MPSEKWIMWNFTVKEIQMVNMKNAQFWSKNFSDKFFLTNQMGGNYCLIRGVGNGRETGNSHTLNGNINHGKVSEGNLA